MKHLVQVVIPIYTPHLKPFEEAALAHNVAILNDLPLVFLIPESICISHLTVQYPQAKIVKVSDNWLGTTNGIQGYNEMMLSADFYNLFTDSTYILICHLDAWIFENKVSEWCLKGYDHVAAPWVTRPKYNYFPFKQYLQLRRFFKRKGHNTRKDLYGKVGNGGFSLRKVDIFYNCCKNYHDLIVRYSQKQHKHYNEDVFWAVEPNLYCPKQEEAATFSIDGRPKRAFKLIHGKLPMACHSFHRHWAFWHRYIPELQTILS